MNQPIKENNRNLTKMYSQVGVSISRGNNSVKKIKKYVEKTYNHNVLSKHGDFSGMYKLGKYTLVSSIDGVGTKTKFVTNVLKEQGYRNLGKDLVNHLTNDILVQGAYPLFFLDYFGTSYLKEEEITNFIKGISDSCTLNNNIPLMGGETAEMPLIYQENTTDLVGCMFGLKDSRFSDFMSTKHNQYRLMHYDDILVGLPSVGPHTNGYSLINNIVKNNGLPNDKDIIYPLLEPHKSYLHEIEEFTNIFGHDQIKAMCHVTGGGILDNLKRVIPKHFQINLDIDSLYLPKWCQYIMNTGNVTLEEMQQVYNCGIGFVIVVSPQVFDKMYQLSFSFTKIGNVSTLNHVSKNNRGTR